jgi:hypothetical protein
VPSVPVEPEVFQAAMMRKKLPENPQKLLLSLPEMVMIYQTIKMF